MKSPALLLAAGMTGAAVLYSYAALLPLRFRLGFDAVEYLSIARGFRSLHDVFSYVAFRTYGFPLFLYFIKAVFHPESEAAWVAEASAGQFLFHIIACLAFYAFFLKKIL